MLDLPDLKLLAVLLKVRSLADAARRLNVTPPAMSVRLQRIETKFGVKLVMRSSRQFALTDSGRRLAAEAQVLLEQIESLHERVGQTSQEFAGPLHIAAPFGFGRRYMAPLVHQFMQQHPMVVPTLLLAEDPLREHPDADVVIHIGRMRDSSWVAHKLFSNERWLCASPQYVHAHGDPSTPQELANHRCLCLQENHEDGSLWSLRRKAGERAKAVTVRVTPSLVTNDGDVLCQWAERGLGVVLRSQWDLAGRIASGTLVRVLPGWQGERADVFALVAARHGLTRRVSAFLAHARSELRGTSE